MDRRDNVAGPRPSDDAASSTERMRSRLTRSARGPLSSVTERTEGSSDVGPKKSPPVAPKRASLRERLTRRPSITKPAGPPPTFGAAGNPPAVPQLAPTSLSRQQILPPRPRTSPPVPSRERKPDIFPRGRSMARRHPDDVFLNSPESESEYSSNLSANTQATSIFESDVTPKPVERERRMVRRPPAAVKKTAVVRAGRAARSVGAQPRRMIHIQVQPQRSATSEPSEDSTTTQFQEEINRLRQEVRDLKQYQSSSDRGLEDALDRLSLVALEREEDKRTMHQEKHTHESLKREVEQRCKTIVSLKARLEEREETLDSLTTRFDARARELDELKTQIEARERNLDEVKAILANRENTIQTLREETNAAVKEKEDRLLDSLKANATLLEEINGLEKASEEMLAKKQQAEEERDGLAKEKELWVMEREKFGLEVDHLRDEKLELQTKCDELTKEIDTRLAVRSDQETVLIERVAALEIIQESLDGQVDGLTTKIATGQTEIDGLKKALEEGQAALEETTKSLEEARGNVEAAKTELETVKDGLEKEKTTLETRITEAEGETAELKTKLEDLEGEKKAGEEQITTLTTERDDLKTKSTELEEQLEKLQENETTTRTDLEALREKEAAAGADLEKLRAENATLQGEVTAAREAANTATESAPADTTEVDGLRTENVELKQKNEELEARATKAASDLEEKSSKLEEESKRLEEAAKKIEEGLKKLEDESARAASAPEAAAGGDGGRAEELAKRVEELEGEKASLAAQLEAATAKVNELNATHQGELVALRAQIRGLARMSSSRSKSPKKRVKGDELVIVRNPQDRSLL